MPANNHFISVSRGGELFARRVGAPPIRVAHGDDGLEIPVPDGRPGAPTIRVFFAYHPGARRRSLYLTDVEAAGERSSVAEFQARHAVTDEELGRWLRAAVERALDAAAPPSPPAP